MQGNWSFMLNIFFLAIILSMIAWRMRAGLKNMLFKKKPSYSEYVPPVKEDLGDDIIEVRRVQDVFIEEEEDVASPSPVKAKPHLGLESTQEMTQKNIMVFLAAKGQNVFAGYDLLQTLLACGLRYGDSGLFHRHQHATGQGPVLFSLAAATATGMFDLQNMGAMTVRGLCMFMELSGNLTIDQERYDIFIQTAKQLAEELQANLLDEKQRPLTLETYAKFERMISDTMEV